MAASLFVASVLFLVVSLFASPVLLIRGSEVEPSGISYTIPFILPLLTHCMVKSSIYPAIAGALVSVLSEGYWHRGVFDVMNLLWVLLFLFVPRGYTLTLK